MNLRNAARGRDCTIRLPNCCNFNTETTVGAHFRMAGVSGMGIKSPDILIAWACSACHQKVDTDKSDETQLAFAKGVFRTIEFLWREGILRASRS
jgi:hypothetical protein